MEWLKKYWIVPLIIIIVIGVYIYLTSKQTSVTTGEDDQAKYGNLGENSADFAKWGLSATLAADGKSVLIRAQGNGNATEFVWTRDRDTQFHHQGEYTIGSLSEIPNNHNLESSDGDFALNIRSVSYAGQLQYCVISVWDTTLGAIDSANPQNSKAAVQVNWTEKKVVVIKAAPTGTLKS